MPRVLVWTTVGCVALWWLGPRMWPASGGEAHGGSSVALALEGITVDLPIGRSTADPTPDELAGPDQDSSTTAFWDGLNVRIARDAIQRDSLFHAWRKNAPGIVILSPLVVPALDTLWRLSPSFRAVAESLVQSRAAIAIGTATDLERELPRALWGGWWWLGAQGTFPIEPGWRFRFHNRADRYSALVDIPRTVRLEQRLHGPLARPSRAVQRVLAHEVYGHLWPQVHSGRRTPAACPDPPAEQRMYDSCVYQREWWIMEELEGLNPDTVRPPWVAPERWPAPRSFSRFRPGSER